MPETEIEVSRPEFDYSAIDAEDRKVIRRRTNEIRERLERTRDDVHQIGQRLIDVKKRLDHGQFQEWLAAEFEWSERTARSLMAVADAFAADEVQGIAPSALYALSSPSVPEAARKEATKIAARGGHVTHAMAREIIDDHKPRVAKTTLLNGEPTTDPEDVADARANGRIGEDIIVEVTEPPIVEPVEPFQPPAQTDEEWLESLPLTSKLEGQPLKLFKADALAYRQFEPHRDTAKHHAARIFPNKGKKLGAYAFAVRQFLSRPHPKSWHQCPKPEDGGCDGTGQVPTIGQCAKCHGRGYWL